MLRKAADDFIARQNVHKFDGLDKFTQHLSLLKAAIKDDFPDAENQVIAHFEKLALFYVFE